MKQFTEKSTRPSDFNVNALPEADYIAVIPEKYTAEFLEELKQQFPDLHPIANHSSGTFIQFQYCDPSKGEKIFLSSLQTKLLKKLQQEL